MKDSDSPAIRTVPGFVSVDEYGNVSAAALFSQLPAAPQPTPFDPMIDGRWNWRNQSGDWVPVEDQPATPTAQG